MQDSLTKTVEVNQHVYQLPKTSEPWLNGKKKAIRQRSAGNQKTAQTLKHWLQKNQINWPQRDVVFISDLHADPDALAASLVASGKVEIVDATSYHFRLLKAAKKTLFIFGGDFFDKGPSNLELLRALKNFIDCGAKVRLLAGNHDIRVLFGMYQAGKTDDSLNGHFFVRMGRKAIPFLAEIDAHYFGSQQTPKNQKHEAKALRQLLPQDSWWQVFPEQAKRFLTDHALEKELEKIKQKSEQFPMVCTNSDFTAFQCLRAAKKWQELFLAKDGEFYWFYRKMRLASRQGSFLFLHAGLDDTTADILREHGVARINNLFRKLLKKSAFEFYYGSIANAIRTKYRVTDKPLTKRGATSLQEAGINALVHGHRNLHHGQRIALRKNLLHFECDVTMDAGSRKSEGLNGGGAGATIIRSGQEIWGISTDYPKIKVFQPNSITQ